MTPHPVFRFFFVRSVSVAAPWQLLRARTLLLPTGPYEM